MRFKAGVLLTDLKPQTVLALCVCDSVYSDLGLDMTVTSVNDGKHMTRSKHYEGRAFDLRTKDIHPQNRKTLTDEIRHRLGLVGYDVVWESVGKANEHLHVEYDPK